MPTHLINSPLDDQASSTSWHQLLKHLLKVNGHLFEGTFNSFVLALIEDLNEFLNRRSGFVEILSSSQKLISLLCEVVILLESFLVYMGEFLESFVDIVKFFH